jgi:23S rRNA (guanosine2251-2'-O)-methyltransferase
MPLVLMDNLDLLTELRRRGLQLLGCLAGVRRTLFQTDLAQPCILAIGGEKRGLSGAVRSICDDFLTIPNRPRSASLPLSAAAAIVLAEAMRQRGGGV